MTLPRLASLSAYWNKNPPTHIIGAAFAGVKPQPQRKKGAKADELPEFATLPDEEE